MTSTATISVAMATYNGAAFVREQVASILAQTRRPDEIVVSDDASTDGTLDLVVDVVGGQVPLVILRNRTPLGVTGNFERAIAACRSDLIALSDQDDLWVPTRLEAAAHQFADRDDLDLLHSNARLVDHTGAPLGETLFDSLGVRDKELHRIHAGRALDVLLTRNVVTGATTMVRRRLAQSAMPFPHGWVHDEWLGVIAATTSGVDVLEMELIDYRQHGGNQIGASSLGWRGKLARLREPREARNQRLASNWATLAERLSQFGSTVPPEVVASVRAKASHEAARSTLPIPRWRRLVPVLRAAASGQYARFSRGTQDVVRDLVQPAGSATG